MYISTSDIKYRLKEKIQRYLNEDGIKRQGIAQETQSFRRPLAKSVEKQVSDDGGGIGSTIAQYAPMVAMMAAPSIIGAVKTKLTQKVAANALKTAVVGAPIIIKEDGPRRQGVAQETQSFRRPTGNANTNTVSARRTTISQEDKPYTEIFGMHMQQPGEQSASEALATSIYGDEESIKRDARVEADDFQREVESSGRGQAMRDADAEAKKITDKFDAGLKAAQNGTSAGGKQEQNQTLKITAGSGNTRVQGGSITFTSKQDQSMKGIDPRSPGYDEQNREVSIEVRNAAVPRVEGSKSDSLLNKKMQELATRRQGYIKLGDVNITDSQRQGTGPSADTLTGAAQGSRGTATPTATPTGTPLDPTVIRMKKERDLLAAQGKTKGVIINGVVQSDSGPSADTLTGAVRAKADQMNTERVKRVKEREAKEQGTAAPTATPTATSSPTQSNKPLKPLSYNSVIDENGNDRRTGKPATDLTREIDDDKKDMFDAANKVRATGNTKGTFVGGKLQDGGATTTGQDGSTRTTRTTQHGNETREEEISQYDAANDPSKKAARKVMGVE